MACIERSMIGSLNTPRSRVYLIRIRVLQGVRVSNLRA